jgi:hypothetical protein
LSFDSVERSCFASVPRSPCGTGQEDGGGDDVEEFDGRPHDEGFSASAVRLCIGQLAYCMCECARVCMVWYGRLTGGEASPLRCAGRDVG